MVASAKAKLYNNNMKKKNSLIELYRFIFSMNVVKNHGYFPYQGSYFSPGRISVEFFFILSGWFLVRGIEKYLKMSYFKGLFSLLKDKLLRLGVPFFVGILFNILCNFITGVDSIFNISIWVYLWYIEDMLTVFIFYYTVKRFVKNEKQFVLITAFVFVVSAVFHSLPEFYAWGTIRAFSEMSLGILISYLPMLKFKKKWLLYIPLTVVWVFILKLFLFNFSFLEDEILNFVMYPLLVYFTFNLEVDNKVFNYLGSLSFGLYAYQSVARFFGLLGYENLWILFLLVFVPTLITDLIKRIIQHKKQILMKKNSV